MNIRKTLVTLVFVVIGLVVAYNLLVMPALNQTTYRMGMHGMSRQGGTYLTNASLFNFQTLAALVLLVIMALLLIDLLMASNKQPRQCRACGCKLKPEWGICPMCGKPANSARRLDR